MPYVLLTSCHGKAICRLRSNPSHAPSNGVIFSLINMHELAVRGGHSTTSNTVRVLMINKLAASPLIKHASEASDIHFLLRCSFVTGIGTNALI